jgi:hypothetical protein
MTDDTTAKIPHLLDLMANGIRDAIESGRALTRAGRAHLQLEPDLHSAVDRLRAAGITLMPQSAAITVTEGKPRFTRLPFLPGQTTDLVSIGRVLHGPSGQPLAVLVFEQAYAGWSAHETLKGLDAVSNMIERQLWALSLGPALFAAPMLNLATHLQDIDHGAISHALGGLLRVLARKSPSRAETIAMQIAGIAQSAQASLDMRDVILTDQAQQLLDQIGIGRMTGEVAVVAFDSQQVEDNKPKRPEILEPFARLRVLEEDFEIAEVPDTEHFWFRKVGAPQEDWQVLANRAADGWAAIASEVVQATRDVPMEYARMHMIRRRDVQMDEIAEVYDINGVVWWVRQGERGLEARLHGDTWHEIDIEPGQPSRDVAIRALHRLAPTLFDMLSVPARDWVNRMCRSVQITPCLSIAAE